MSPADVAPVVARIAARISAVANIGLVHDHDLYSRDDLQPLVVSTIAGTPTLRAWWISGPTMAAAPVEQRAGGYQHRWWTYTVHGLEGLDSDGASLNTLRANALAVCDSLDSDPDLGRTCQRSWPCEWAEPPELRNFLGLGTLPYIEISKRALTLSTPS